MDCGLIQCCRLQMLKNMAGEYMNKGGGGGASSEASAGGTDWSSLANLASHMGSADQEASSGGDLFSTFTQKCDTPVSVLMLPDPVTIEARHAAPNIIRTVSQVDWRHW